MSRRLRENRKSPTSYEIVENLETRSGPAPTDNFVEKPGSQGWSAEKLFRESLDPARVVLLFLDGVEVQLNRSQA